MAFPDEEAKLRPGRISMDEKELILEMLGAIAQDKYDEYIVQGGRAKGYSLGPLQGSLKFTTNPESFENDYHLEGENEHWTNVANYFEYGTGLYNQRRAGKYRAGYIRPTTAEYMKFTLKGGTQMFAKKVKGVHPIFAMEKAVKYVQFNRPMLQRDIRMAIQNG